MQADRLSMKRLLAIRDTWGALTDSLWLYRTGNHDVDVDEEGSAAPQEDGPHNDDARPSSTGEDHHESRTQLPAIATLPRLPSGFGNPEVLYLPNNHDSRDLLYFWSQLFEKFAYLLPLCKWFYHIDPEVYVNIPAITERVNCLDETQPHYFGLLAGMINYEDNENFLMHNRDVGFLLSRELASLASYWTKICLNLIPPQPYTYQGIGYVFATCLADLGKITVENFADEQRNFVHGDEGRAMDIFFHETNPIMRKCLFAIGPVDSAEQYYDIKTNLSWASWHQGVDCKGETDMGHYTFRDTGGVVRSYYRESVKLAIWKCGQERYQKLDEEEVNGYCAGKSPRDGEGSVALPFFDQIVVKKRRRKAAGMSTSSGGGTGSSSSFFSSWWGGSSGAEDGSGEDDEVEEVAKSYPSSSPASGTTPTTASELLLRAREEETRSLSKLVYGAQLLASHSVDVPIFSDFFKQPTESTDTTLEEDIANDPASAAAPETAAKEESEDVEPFGYLNVEKIIPPAAETSEVSTMTNDTEYYHMSHLSEKNADAAEPTATVDDVIEAITGTVSSSTNDELEVSPLVETARDEIINTNPIVPWLDEPAVVKPPQGKKHWNKIKINKNKAASNRIFPEQDEDADPKMRRHMEEIETMRAKIGETFAKNLSNWFNSEDEHEKNATSQLIATTATVSSGPKISPVRLPVSDEILENLQLQKKPKPDPKFFLCIFIPVSFRKKSYIDTARAARDTWARNSSDIAVFFLEPPGTIATQESFREDRRVPTVTFEEDLETDYAHLPLRTFRMFEVLGRNPVYRDLCHWYMKADADSHVHTSALLERLSCFTDSRKMYYLGVPQVAEGRYGKNSFFASGGGGYFLSRGLIAKAGIWSSFCLLEAIRGVGGAGMEDVMLAGCLRKWGGVDVAQYGLDSEFSTDTRRHTSFRSKEQPAKKCRFVTHSLTAREIFRVHRWRYRGLCLVDKQELERDALVVSYSTAGELLKAPKFRTAEYRALYQCSLRQVVPVVEHEHDQLQQSGGANSKSNAVCGRWMGGTKTNADDSIISTTSTWDDLTPPERPGGKNHVEQVAASTGTISLQPLPQLPGWESESATQLVQRALVRGARCVDTHGRYSFSRDVTLFGGNRGESSVEKNGEVEFDVQTPGGSGRPVGADEVAVPQFVHSSSSAWILEYSNNTIQYPMRCLEVDPLGTQQCLD
ncbi:unnamed protein product [Amoebophrya sp. A120]|nr:unnamed protein product [Amoebophrya sp. A120]|eukprot:GSA120T00014822001.1